MSTNAAVNNFDRADALGEKIAELAAELTAGAYRLIKAIGEFDALDGPMKQGALTTEQWLSWRIGMSKHEAREKVRVAKALRDLPVTTEAFSTARISYSKTRAIVRVATPENEDVLVNIALSCPAAQLETICRKFQSVVTDENRTKPPQDAEEERYVRQQWTEEGMLRVTVQLPADEGARLIAAIESGQSLTEADKGHRPNKADGLMTVVESYFADGPKPRKGGAPNEVTVHVCAESLADETEGAFIENAGGQAVSAETARRLSCDAGVIRMVENAKGEVLDVGRKTRTIPPAIRRAVEARDGRVCAFPGCDHTAYLDGHHLTHWADGGETSASNVALVCSRHHRWVHEHHYRAFRDESGAVVVVDPGGTRVEACPDLPNPDASELHRRNIADGIHVNADSLTPNWDGEPIDHDQVIVAICSASPGSFL